ncbi:hypothetical protein, partial [Streptomyces tauricus]|uniref:hypothetical protein n=1 Tax=Streptomyces tauricus TaxID=68274 RepID=UPI001BCA4C72
PPAPPDDRCPAGSDVRPGAWAVAGDAAGAAATTCRTPAARSPHVRPMLDERDRTRPDTSAQR